MDNHRGHHRVHPDVGLHAGTDLDDCHRHAHGSHRLFGIISWHLCLPDYYVDQFLYHSDPVGRDLYLSHSITFRSSGEAGRHYRRL